MAVGTLSGPVDPGKVSSDRKPSARQVYALAHIACELLGQEWPADRRSMSELIATLHGAQAPAASSEIPF